MIPWGRIVSRLLRFLALLLFVQTGFAANLKVGLIVEDVTPPIGVPQGGYAGGKRRIIPWDVFNKYEYATFLRPSTGTLDPIRIKVMVLRRDDKKIAFLSSDTVGINAEFLKDLTVYLGDAWNPNEIFMGATHSHSGPGGLAKSLMWQLIAMDRFLPEVYWRTVQQTGDAIIKAYSEATEAELFSTEFKADGLQKNRRDDHAPMHFDPVAHLVLAKNAQGWLGGMVNYSGPRI